MKKRGRSGQGHTEITQFRIHFLMLSARWLNKPLHLKFRIHIRVAADPSREDGASFSGWPLSFRAIASERLHFHFTTLDVRSCWGNWEWINDSVEVGTFFSLYAVLYRLSGVSFWVSAHILHRQQLSKRSKWPILPKIIPSTLTVFQPVYLLKWFWLKCTSGFLLGDINIIVWLPIPAWN